MAMYRKSSIAVALILLAAGLTAGISTVMTISYASNEQSKDKMPAFTSYGQLAAFLDASKSGYNTDYSFNGAAAGLHDPAKESDSAQSSGDYSRTNVQVEGIDELDTVKTDGNYIYASSYDSIAIIKASPSENMSVVSWINASDLAAYVNDTYGKTGGYSTYVSINGIFVVPGRLIVVSYIYSWQDYYDGDGGTVVYSDRMAASGWMQSSEQTAIFVMDLEDIEQPAILSLFGMSGYPVTSRMQGDMIYSVSQLYVWKGEGGYGLPEVSGDGNAARIAINDIHYDPDTKDPGYYLNILALNLTELKSKSISIIAGWSSTIYKSQDSLYLTIEKWPMMPVMVLDGPVASAATDDDIPVTTIYRIDVEGLSMHVSEKGDVRGVLRDQFSMDEKGGYLRVATGTGLWLERSSAVYVLDRNLSVVGSIEGIAVNESIQACRFVGDRLYLVTFRQVDPLFVIDLSVPTAPVILGELTLPGFSTYLHPVDENHILGIGIEGSSAKISLFDVSDPSAPAEVSKYMVGNCSSTSAGWEHKAVLFDAEKELLVIPMSTYNYSDWNSTFFGFYVFRVSVDDGISLRGSIDHGNSSYYYYSDGRALYIGDYLYTVSGTIVKANLISDLSEAGELVYGQAKYYFVYSTGVETISVA